ncbi:putative lipoprotein [Mariprofundus aestuarium]|uniref:Putative lipoprotein n=1 Tax=Mariprofundus aestuarium TaxID=1921086 RepID=A0A2K8L074_MARES|nr:YajG family lipoprotein [Mariprofundus aestuarium]ATX80690.1 putative lipoprotein [Mariprofundus aestuarium]
MLKVKRNMMLMLMSLAMPLGVHAGEISTDVIYPKESAAIATGSGEVALWVEDARKSKLFGRAVDGEYLVPASDVAASLYAHMVTSLKAAGYQLVPYSAEIANGMLVRIQSIEYTATREMIKSTVAAKVVLESKMNHSTTTHSYRAAVEDQFALSPSSKENGETIGLALATAASSLLADFKLSDSAH